MTSRQRVLAAIAHREPDRVPADLGATTRSAHSHDKLKLHVGLSGGQLRVDDIVQHAKDGLQYGSPP